MYIGCMEVAMKSMTRSTHASRRDHAADEVVARLNGINAGAVHPMAVDTWCDLAEKNAMWAAHWARKADRRLRQGK